jgi:hypothetical protein
MRFEVAAPGAGVALKAQREVDRQSRAPADAESIALCKAQWQPASLAGCLLGRSHLPALSDVGADERATYVFAALCALARPRQRPQSGN